MVEKTFWKTVLGVFLFCLILILYLRLSGVAQRAGLGAIGFVFFPGIPLLLSGFALFIGLVLFVGQRLEKRLSNRGFISYRLPGSNIFWVVVTIFISLFLISFLLELGVCLRSDQLLVPEGIVPRGHWSNCFKVIR